MQRRSTRAIIARLLMFFGAIIAVHVATRIIYASMIASWSGNSFLEDIWNFGADRPELFWPSVALHFLGIIACGVLWLIIWGLVALFRWIFFQPEDDPNECRDRNCRCTEHRGLVFDDEDRRWYYDDSDIAMAAAAGAVAGAVVGGTIANS